MDGNVPVYDSLDSFFRSHVTTRGEAVCDYVILVIEADLLTKQQFHKRTHLPTDGWTNG